MNKLRVYREILGLSRDELSRKVNIPNYTLKDIEIGRSCSYFNSSKLCEFFIKNIDEKYKSNLDFNNLTGDTSGSVERAYKDVSILYNRIKWFREVLGLTQGDLVSFTGIPQWKISEIETFKIKVNSKSYYKSIDIIHDILRVFNTRFNLNLKPSSLYMARRHHIKKPSLKKATAKCSNLGDKDSHTKITTSVVSDNFISKSSYKVHQEPQRPIENNLYSSKSIQDINRLIKDEDVISMLKEVGISKNQVSLVGSVLISKIVEA